MNGARPAAARTFVLLLCAAPVALQALLVPRFGVNVLISDEWSLIPFARLVVDGGNWPAHLFDLFNENRPAVLRIILALSIPYTRWDAMPIMYLSVAVSGVLTIGLWRVYRAATGLHAIFFVPVAWWAIGLAQYQNLFWALQITFLLTACSAVWCVLAATRTGPRSLAAAILLAVICTFSSAGGTLIWPVVLLILAGRRAGWAAVAWWVAAMAATGAGYAYGFHAGATAPGTATPGALGIVHFALVLIGASASPVNVSGAAMAGATAVLIATALAVGLLRQRDRLSAGEWAALGVALFGVVYAGLTTAGRARFGVEWALTSRYVTITMLIWIGLYILALTRVRGAASRRYLAGGVATVALVIAVVADVHSWPGATAWGRSYGRVNKFILQTHPTIGPVELRAMTIHPEHAGNANDERAYLASHDLSYFHDRVEWWLLVDPSDLVSLPVSEGTPVVQQFVCPVDTLYDAAMQLAPGQDVPTAGLRVDVIDPAGGLVLGSRVIARAGLQPGQFVVGLRRPLERCRGRSLTVVLTALQGSGDNAFTAYHFPPFLEGTLEHGGPIPDRSLGVELNTGRFDIRDLR